MKKYLLLAFGLYTGFSVLCAPVSGKPGNPDPGLRFEQNKGQTSPVQGKQVLFTLRDKGITLFFTKNSIQYQWLKRTKDQSVQIDAAGINWPDANQNPEVVPELPYADFSNYYTASHPEGIKGVKSYSKITYRGLYPHTDVTYYIEDGKLKYKISGDGGKIHAGDLAFAQSSALGSVSQQGTAAAGVISWSTYYGGTGSDEGWATTTDANNNVFLTGVTNSTDGISSPGAFQPGMTGTGLDVFIVKFNSAGVRQWASYYGGDNYEMVRSIATDPGGNVFIAGSTRSTSGIASPGGHQTIFQGGSFDAFLVKFDASGNRVWGTYYGGAPNADGSSGDDLGTSVATDASGNVYLAGTAGTRTGLATGGSHRSSGVPTVGVGGFFDYYDTFLVKFNAAGTRLWATYYGGKDDAPAVATDAAGNVYLGGKTTNTMNIEQGFSGTFVTGGYEAYLAKFNSSGIRQWGRYYGLTYSQPKLAADPSGNVFLSGTTWTTTNASSQIVPAFDYSTDGAHQEVYGGGLYDNYLAKFNTSGTLQWGTYYGGLGEETSYVSLVADAGGNVYLQGNTASGNGIASAGEAPAAFSGNTAFVAKLNPAGTRIWGRYLIASANLTARGIALDAEGGLYIGGDGYLPAPNGHQNEYGGGFNDAVLVKIGEAKADQAITFNALESKVFGDADFEPGATASSGLTVTYTSNNPDVATIVDGKVHITGAGGASITATQVGNGSFNAALPVSRSLIVNKAANNIVFSAIPAKAPDAADFDPGATASSGLTVVYTSSDLAIATIVDGKIHIVKPGTVNITAVQTGNANFNAANPVTVALTINKKSQITTFSSFLAKAWGNADFEIEAESSSGLPLTFTSDNTDIATIVEGNKIHIVKPGTVFIRANQAGNEEYNAAPQTSQPLVVSKAFQEIIHAGDFSPLYFRDPDRDFNIQASSGLPVSYTNSDSHVGTIVNNKLRVSHPGLTVITASQAGNDYYLPAVDWDFKFTVQKLYQNISFGPILPKREGDPDFDPAATAESGLPVRYTSSNTAVATIVSGRVHIVGAGTATITAHQDGDGDNAAAGTREQVLTVYAGPAPQIITFSSFLGKGYGDADFEIEAESSSGLPLSFSSADPSIATILAGNKIHILKPGVVFITATQEGNADFRAAAPVRQPLTIGKAMQSIIRSGNFADLFYKDPDRDFHVLATSGLPVSYQSEDVGIGTFVNGKFRVSHAGQTVITITQPGNDFYHPAEEWRFKYDVKKLYQNITFNALPLKHVGDPDFEPGALANSGLPVKYASSNAAVATVTGGGSVIRITGPGSAVITARQEGDSDNAAAAEKTQTLTVLRPQMINPLVFGTRTYGDADFNLAASSSSGLPVSYASSNPSVATIVGGQIHIAGAGSTNITVTQTGNAEYDAAAPLVVPLVIGKAAQVIRYEPGVIIVYRNFIKRVEAEASSGLPLEYAVVNPAIASLSGDNLLGIRIGITYVTISQPGDDNYLPAAPKRIEVKVYGEREATILFNPALSPNGDGMNDVLILEGITAYPLNELKIFTASGKVVFDGRNYNNVTNLFSGMFKGDLLPAGTYYYSLLLKRAGDSPLRQTGAIEIRY